MRQSTLVARHRGSGALRDDTGFSLAELVVASALLPVVCTAVLASLSYAAAASGMGRA